MNKVVVRTSDLAVGAMGSLLLLAGAPARAWDGLVSGAIQQIDIADGQNYAFRVCIANAPAACAGGPNWSYLNEADSNYKTYVAAQLTARAQGPPSLSIRTWNTGIAT